MGHHLLAALLAGAEADLDPVEFCDLGLEDGLSEGDFEVGPRLDRPNRHTEPFDDTFFIRRDDEDTLPDKQDEHRSNDEIPDSAGRQKIFEPTSGEEIFELRLRLFERVLKRIRLLAPRIFWVPDHSVMCPIDRCSK